MSRFEDLRRRLRQTSGRRRKLRGLAELLAPYRWRVLAMFVALVAATGSALAPAPLAKLAIDDGIKRHDVATLDWVVAAFLASALVYAVASYAQTYLVGWVGQRALQDLRLRLFSHLQRLSIGFYSRNRAGVIISRITNDVEALDQLVGGLAAINGHTSTGVVFAFIAALNNFFDPIQQLSQLYTTYKSGMAALDKIFDLLDEEPDIVDPPNPLQLPTLRGELRFDHVSFRYGAGQASGDGEWALDDVDLTIAPGETVALVGETG